MSYIKKSKILSAQHWHWFSCLITFRLLWILWQLSQAIFLSCSVKFLDSIWLLYVNYHNTSRLMQFPVQDDDICGSVFQAHNPYKLSSRSIFSWMPKYLTDHNNPKIAFAAFSSLCTCGLQFVWFPDSVITSLNKL